MHLLLKVMKEVDISRFLDMCKYHNTYRPFQECGRRNERGQLCLHSQINLPPVENCIWIVNTAASECEY